MSAPWRKGPCKMGFANCLPPTARDRGKSDGFWKFKLFERWNRIGINQHWRKRNVVRREGGGNDPTDGVGSEWASV